MVRPQAAVAAPPHAVVGDLDQAAQVDLVADVLPARRVGQAPELLQALGSWFPAARIVSRSGSWPLRGSRGFRLPGGACQRDGKRAADVRLARDGSLRRRTGVASFFTVDRPSPLPRMWRVFSFLIRTKSLNSRPASSGVMPMPVSSTSIRMTSPVAACRHPNAPLVAVVLHGVGDQVVEDHLDLGPVRFQAQAGGHVQLDLDISLLRPRP